MAQSTFRAWAKRKVPGAEFMNVGSGAQVQQLLFPGTARQKPSNSGPVEQIPEERVFKVCFSPVLQNLWAVFSLLQAHPLSSSKVTMDSFLYWAAGAKSHIYHV